MVVEEVDARLQSPPLVRLWVFLSILSETPPRIRIRSFIVWRLALYR